MYRKSRWDTQARGPMTESAVRAIHKAPERARVSAYTYKAGDELEGTSKRCTGYVLKGRLTFAANEGVTVFEAGDVFLFSGGDYLLTINELAAAVVVWAWELPQQSH